MIDQEKLEVDVVMEEVDKINIPIFEVLPKEFLGRKLRFTGWKPNFKYLKCSDEQPTLLDRSLRSQVLIPYGEGFLFVDSTGTSGFSQKDAKFPSGHLSLVTLDTPPNQLMQRAKEMFAELEILAKGKIN